MATDVLASETTGPWLGDDAGIGIDVPDVVVGQAPFDMVIEGVEHPRDASCVIMDLATGRTVRPPRLTMLGGRIGARVSVPAPGLYRVQVVGGGTSAVSQLVLVSEPSALQGAADER